MSSGEEDEGSFFMNIPLGPWGIVDFFTLLLPGK